MVSIPSLIILGLGAISAFFFFKRAAETSLPQAAAETGSAFGSIGSGLGGLGGGISALGSGIGSGITGLFSPLTFFSNLINRISPPTSAPQPNPVRDDRGLPPAEFTAGASTGCDDCFFPSRESVTIATSGRISTGAVVGSVPVTVNTSGLSASTISALGL